MNGENKENDKASGGKLGGIIDNVFVARQPIFDREMNVRAYELLYREQDTDIFSADDHNYATSRLLSSSFMAFDIKELTDGLPAYVNFPRSALVSGVAGLFPPEHLVIEVLETVQADGDVIRACRDLKAKGYRIVLDDFVFSKEFQPLVEMADVIKIDFLAASELERRTIFRKAEGSGAIFLAEKIESREHYEIALKEGFSLFQGFFFARPVTLSRLDITGDAVSALRSIEAVYRSKVQLEEIEHIFEGDTALRYKLLRFMSSVSPNPVATVREALSTMSLPELRSWVSLVALCSISGDKPKQLLGSSAVRAKFAEMVAERTGRSDKAHFFFAAGLFSLIDAFLDMPLNKLMEHIEFEDELKESLLQGTDESITQTVRLCTACEQGKWADVVRLCKSLELDERSLPSIHLASVRFARKVTGLA